MPRNSPRLSFSLIYQRARAPGDLRRRHESRAAQERERVLTFDAPKTTRTRALIVLIEAPGKYARAGAVNSRAPRRFASAEEGGVCSIYTCGECSKVVKGARRDGRDF